MVRRASPSSVEDKLQKFIGEDLLGDEPIDLQTGLLNGIINSFSLARLLTFVQETFGLEMPKEALTPDNLQDIQHLAALIRSLEARPKARRKR